MQPSVEPIVCMFCMSPFDMVNMVNLSAFIYRTLSAMRCLCFYCYTIEFCILCFHLLFNDDLRHCQMISVFFSSSFLGTVQPDIPIPYSKTVLYYLFEIFSLSENVYV